MFRRCLESTPKTDLEIRFHFGDNFSSINFSDGCSSLCQTTIEKIKERVVENQPPVDLSFL